jgi:lauroyl/myristoyl acyltransferase
MNFLIYWFGRAFIAFIQLLPLNLVARLGRAGGGLAFYLTGRYRRVVLQNLTLCFAKKKSAEEIYSLAKESFRRIGENYLCAIKTAAMSFEKIKPHLEFIGFEKFPKIIPGRPTPNILAAIGHFGNFEIYARTQEYVPAYQSATTYRALKQPAANRLLKSLRGLNGCLFFERRADGNALRELMGRRGVLLGLLGDQSSQGARLPFLGHDCNTGLAIAVFALRYDCELFPIICYRTALAKWRLEVVEQIPIRENDHPRPSEAIMRDVNLVFEKAVLRDPANWFWVHRRWKD